MLQVAQSGAPEEVVWTRPAHFPVNGTVATCCYLVLRVPELTKKPSKGMAGWLPYSSQAIQLQQCCHGERRFGCHTTGKLSQAAT